MGGLEKIPGEGKYRRGNQGKLQCAFLEITDFFFFRMGCFFLSLWLNDVTKYGVWHTKWRVLNSGQLKCHFGMKRLTNTHPAFRLFLAFLSGLHHWTFLFGEPREEPVFLCSQGGLKAFQSPRPPEPRPMGCCCPSGIPLTPHPPPSPLLHQQAPG